MPVRSYCVGAICGAALLLVAAGCNGSGPGGRTGGTNVIKAPPVDETVLLRYKFVKDRMLRYDFHFKLNSQGDGSVNEKLRAVVKQLCLGPVGEGPGARFYKLNILRRGIDRVKKERDRKGRNQPPITVARTVEPDITPNYGYDAKLNKNYFPCNDRGVFGLSAKAPYHRVVYDSLTYLLPVLPAGKVRRGSTWTADIPVYAGADYFYASGGFRRGNDFKLRMTGRVVRIWRKEGQVLAQLAWTCTGGFGTQAEHEDWPESFHRVRRIMHDVQASGRAVFNVTYGLITQKSGQATITFSLHSLISRVRRGGGRPESRWEKSVIRHVVHYKSRLMAEGEAEPLPSRRRRP